MTIDTRIRGNQNDKTADVTNNGELITRVIKFSTPIKQQITDSNAVNFLGARSKSKIILTGVIINADRNVGVNGALVDLYEASDATSTTIDTSILSIDVAKSTTLIITPLLIETTQGKFINAKADDFNINMTVLGYSVDV